MRKILHISNRHDDNTDDLCMAVVRCLESLPDIEQRVFSPPGDPSLPHYLDSLRGEIRRFRPSFVHYHAPGSPAAACLLTTLPLHVRLIVHWHSDLNTSKRLYALLRPLETALLRRADVIIGTSAAYIEHSPALQPFLDKCVVIPRMIDTSRLVPRSTRLDQIRWRYGDKPLLLFVGRHLPHKGLECMMDAVKRVTHDCRVIVGGEGPLTPRLRRDHLSERIHFAGHIPHDDLAAWYTAADIFLFPSTTRDEVFGVALAEAMWCGTPAVTFTIPGSGVNWVSLNGHTGIEVDNGNRDQLAAAIDHLLSHDDMRREYGFNARRRVEYYMTPDRVAKKLEEIYS
jgi:glycosyltransferase involved in cell wall biosynthesis